MNRPIRISSYDKSEFDQRIEDAERRGYVLVSCGSNPVHFGKITKVRYIAKLKKREEV